MKIKLLSLVLCLLMLFSMLNLSAFATEGRSGISFDFTTTNGISHPEGYYWSEKKLEEIPRTIEAWVYIPEAVHSSKVGAIISNYAGIDNDDFIDVMIEKNGVPRVYVGRGLEQSYATYNFADAAISADTWTHLTIVYGTGTKDKQVYCYINGELKQSTDVSAYVEMDEDLFENTVCIGGDLRSFNTQAFRGILGDIRVYADVRSAKEIKLDMSNPPSDKDMNLMMNYEISSALKGKDIPDVGIGGYDMSYGKIWLSEDEMNAIRSADKTEYAYSIAVIPDPQYSTRSYKDKLPAIFDYLLDNAETKKIQYVLSVGDMTHKNTSGEWETIYAQTERLNGKIPYTAIRGNHDVTYNDYAELFDENYANSEGYYYNHVKNNGGFFDTESAKNTYLLFTAGKVNYLLLNLDWGANDDVLAWADGILKQYSDRRAIVLTHGYLDADGTTLGDDDKGSPSLYTPAQGEKEWNSGDDIWEKLLRKHENVYMVICGHIEQDDIVMTTATGDAGNTVYQLLVDTQTADNKLEGAGFVFMMYFTEDGDNVRTECYSTVYNKYFRSRSNTLTIDLSRGSDEDTSSTVVTNAPENTAPSEGEAEQTEASEEKKGCGGSVVIILPAATAALASVVAVSGRTKSKKSQKRLLK